MHSLISDFTIKSSIEQIINRSYSIRSVDITSIDRNSVISSLWRWTSSPEDLHQTADTDELLELLRERFGADAVVETGTVSNGQNDFLTYEIALPNVRFYIVWLPHCYLLSAAAPASKLTFQSCRPPKQVIDYMVAFNELMPDINRHINDTISRIAMDNMLCNVSAATGKGIVDQLREEGVDIPPISHIRGTPNGRVVLYFADSDEKINSPMDHLRARLTRRFSKNDQRNDTYQRRTQGAL